MCDVDCDFDKCPECGAPTEFDDLECPKCGCSLDDSGDYVECPICGGVFDLFEGLCWECGATAEDVVRHFSRPLKKS